MRQHIFLFTTEKHKSTEKKRGMFVGSVIFAHIHRSVLIMICDVNACYFFFMMLLPVSEGEKNMVCKIDQDIYIFIDFCFCE